MSVDSPPGDAISRSELKEATFTSLRWATLARIAAQILTLAVGVVLAHLVPPDEFGRVAITLVVSELALALANQGAGSVLVQRKLLDHAHVQATAMLALIVGVALSLATLILSPMVATPLFGAETAHLFQLLSPAFIIAAIGIVPLAMLERRLDFRRISLIEIATVLIGSLSSVSLAVLGLEAEAYVLGFVIGQLVWATLLVILGPFALPRWHRRELREITGFGVPAGLASIAMVGYGNVDYLILGARLSPAQVGFYYRAYTLGVQYETKISDIIARVAFPVYSRTESADHMRAVRSRVVRINATVIYPILALFIALAPEVVPWLFGQRWEPAVVPAQILAVAGMARMINNGTPPLLLAAGRPRTLLAFNLCRLGVLGVAVLVASSYGVIAVCLAVAGFQVATLIASYGVMLSRVVGVTLRQLAADLVPAISASAIMLALAFPLTAAVSAATASSPTTIAIVTALTAPVYVVALRQLSSAAWADLMLLTRKVLGRGDRRSPSAGQPAEPRDDSAPSGIPSDADRDRRFHEAVEALRASVEVLDREGPRAVRVAVDARRRAEQRRDQNGDRRGRLVREEQSEVGS
jgi:lipopolysaccharide exporter